MLYIQSIILRNINYYQDILSTSQDLNVEIPKEDLNSGYRKFVAIVTWIVIVLIPTYSLTITPTSKVDDLNHSGLVLKEKTFLWPWMIITKYSAPVFYSANQYAVVAFPWSFILFIPFLYALKASWNLYSGNDNKALNSGYIMIASIVQLFLIYMTYQSQTTKPSEAASNEVVTVYFIPQLFLLIFHGIIGFRWYIEEIAQTRKGLKT